MMMLSCILDSQSAVFRFDNGDDGFVSSVVYTSAFWLSESTIINPTTSNRVILQPGFSSSITRLWGKYWTYPNLDIGIKVTRNLAVTGKIFGFSTGKESPQIIGAGFQYYFGRAETLDWSTSIQRVDLKGLNHFRLASLTLDIRKWISWKFIHFRLGIGSNFFKEVSYSGKHNAPSAMVDQINFMGVDALLRYTIFNIGAGTRIHPDRTMVTLFIQKELF